MVKALNFSRRFRGPVSSCNGGYACGSLASFLKTAGPVSVRLHSPPPLETSLEVKLDSPSQKATLWHADSLVAEATSCENDPIQHTVPRSPSFSEAHEARSRFSSYKFHNYPHCFVCGPSRTPGDALNLFPGRVSGSAEASLVASSWVPDPSLSPSSSVLPEPVVWAALDCPGFFSIGASEDRAFLLGQMKARVVREVSVGQRCVVIGWFSGMSGRKYFTNTALFDQGGGLLAQSEQIWIELKQKVPKKTISAAL